MTLERIQELEALGFCWTLGSGGGGPQQNDTAGVGPKVNLPPEAAAATIQKRKLSPVQAAKSVKILQLQKQRQQQEEEAAAKTKEPFLDTTTSTTLDGHPKPDDREPANEPVMHRAKGPEQAELSGAAQTSDDASKQQKESEQDEETPCRTVTSWPDDNLQNHGVVDGRQKVHLANGNDEKATLPELSSSGEPHAANVQNLGSPKEKETAQESTTPIEYDNNNEHDVSQQVTLTNKRTPPHVSKTLSPALPMSKKRPEEPKQDEQEVSSKSTSEEGNHHVVRKQVHVPPQPAAARKGLSPMPDVPKLPQEPEQEEESSRTTKEGSIHDGVGKKVQVPHQAVTRKEELPAEPKPRQTFEQEEPAVAHEKWYLLLATDPPAQKFGPEDETAKEKSSPSTTTATTKDATIARAVDNQVNVRPSPAAARTELSPMPAADMPKLGQEQRQDPVKEESVCTTTSKDVKVPPPQAAARMKLSPVQKRKGESSCSTTYSKDNNNHDVLPMNVPPPPEGTRKKMSSVEVEESVRKLQMLLLQQEQEAVKAESSRTTALNKDVRKHGVGKAKVPTKDVALKRVPPVPAPKSVKKRRLHKLRGQDQQEAKKSVASSCTTTPTFSVGNEAAADKEMAPEPTTESVQRLQMLKLLQEQAAIKEESRRRKERQLRQQQRDAAPFSIVRAVTQTTSQQVSHHGHADAAAASSSQTSPSTIVQRTKTAAAKGTKSPADTRKLVAELLCPESIFF
uniref:Uncharacterized protein n=2 Tax=Entomoneis paludosa TaxID=265537 RepID=A0A7S3DUQ9_9STRA|mmetsp:Transcript_38327/g.79691  ORF Transcript_38327/g.79691 Transcript_38327/m.79691 type:complete len:738 (+) Transcript_38327:117-2330(+)